MLIHLQYLQVCVCVCVFQARQNKSLQSCRAVEALMRSDPLSYPPGIVSCSLACICCRHCENQSRLFQDGLDRMLIQCHKCFLVIGKCHKSVVILKLSFSFILYRLIISQSELSMQRLACGCNQYCNFDMEIQTHRFHVAGSSWLLVHSYLIKSFLHTMLSY